MTSTVNVRTEGSTSYCSTLVGKGDGWVFMDVLTTKEIGERKKFSSRPDYILRLNDPWLISESYTGKRNDGGAGRGVS